MSGECVGEKRLHYSVENKRAGDMVSAIFRFRNVKAIYSHLIYNPLLLGILPMVIHIFFIPVLL